MAHAILIVDDDLVVREALRRVFRGAEWELATACDAATCMDAYARRRPDVVLLDHGVPGLPGLQLLEVLRERDPDATVVMLTGRAEVPLAVEAMRLGSREELYHRLAVFPLHLPPLRERGRDAIVTLAHQFLAELGRQCGRAPTTFTEEALRRLVAHPWPGNIRELRNTVERVLLVARGEREIGVEHLPVELRPPRAPNRPAAHDDDDGDPDLSLAGRSPVTSRGCSLGSGGTACTRPARSGSRAPRCTRSCTSRPRWRARPPAARRRLRAVRFPDTDRVRHGGARAARTQVAPWATGRRSARDRRQTGSVDLGIRILRRHGPGT
jgi:CheY-like chemotaxis protein